MHRHTGGIGHRNKRGEKRMLFYVFYWAIIEFFRLLSTFTLLLLAALYLCLLIVVGSGSVVDCFWLNCVLKHISTMMINDLISLLIKFFVLPNRLDDNGGDFISSYIKSMFMVQRCQFDLLYVIWCFNNNNNKLKLNFTLARHAMNRIIKTVSNKFFYWICCARCTIVYRHFSLLFNRLGVAKMSACRSNVEFSMYFNFCNFKLNKFWIYEQLSWKAVAFFEFVRSN